MSEQKTTARKATQAAMKVRPLVKSMYRGAFAAKEMGQKVAYTMVGSQYDELLRAMDVYPVWTENYAGLCAAKHDAERFLLRAEADGYSNVVCGYVRCGIGFDAMRYDLGAIPENSPDGGMADPDMYLGSSFFCDPRFKWYQALGHYSDIPVHCMDVVQPHVTANLNEVRDYYIAYQLSEYQDLVAFLEQQTGKKLDYDRLDHCLELGNQAWQLWWECDQIRKAVPSPMPSEDHFNVMVPASFLAGTQQAVDFYTELRDEIQERVRNKQGVIPDERYRLLFAGGIPPWHTMWMFNDFENLGAVFVIENAYRGNDPVHHDIPARVKNPLERMAWRAFLRRTQRFEKAQRNSGHPVVELLLELIEGYGIDGMVFHASRSCRATTVGQLTMKDLVQQYVKLPTLQLISDMVDLRDYSEAQWKMNINAFVDTVAAAKDGRLQAS
ncbi:MAG: 2-hydroxyacyl-CoA dehydratase [Chloroflexi bacterium]|nr:2-hydroxyacyl-CoA dehydratase [Chloroflexota bacterium]